MYRRVATSVKVKEHFTHLASMKTGCRTKRTRRDASPSPGYRCAGAGFLCIHHHGSAGTNQSPSLPLLIPSQWSEQQLHRVAAARRRVIALGGGQTEVYAAGKPTVCLFHVRNNGGQETADSFGAQSNKSSCVKFKSDVAQPALKTFD